MKNFLNKLLIPFAIIHIRIIQYRYKKLTEYSINGRQSNQNLATLKLLQSKEYYYRCQFSAWGKFHLSFAFSPSSHKRHIKYMNWLFPEKMFKQCDIVIWHNPEAVTYYQNKIYELSKGRSPNYEIEIINQLKKWKSESEK